ncbi:T7 exonuclease [Candidatus Poribacteria bacterium]|nr:T7 exonuclease [Candidatus Poribacteria bacterium]
MKLLIDADFIVYKSCAAAENEVDFGNDVILVTSNFSDAYNATKRELTKIENKFGSLSTLILFFSDSVNFRKKILESYKGHRNRKKPCGYKRVIEALKKEYKVIIKPGLEADDTMGVYSTKFPGNTIVSPDKDMRQIPGQLYNFEEVFTITPEEGAKWHLIQSCAGDQTDGYGGVPGIGVKRATNIFEEKGYSWKTVVEMFKDKGFDEEEALTNARLARILTVDDYDFKRKEPILWNPSSDYRIDDGAGSTNEDSRRQTK